MAATTALVLVLSSFAVAFVQHACAGCWWSGQFQATECKLRFDVDEFRRCQGALSTFHFERPQQ